MQTHDRCADISMRSFNTGMNYSRFTASTCGFQDSSRNSSRMSAKPRLIEPHTTTGDVECAGHAAHL
jgi:hypothetical protein